MTPERIKHIRQSLGLSVRQAVEAMGLSASSQRKWRRWESGQEDMPQGIAVDFAQLAHQHGI